MESLEIPNQYWSCIVRNFSKVKSTAVDMTPFSPNGFSGVLGNKGTWPLWTGQQENEDIKYLKLCLKQCSDKNSFGNWANDMMELKVFKRCEATLEHHCEYKGRKNGDNDHYKLKHL